ncbi:MAG: patatin-like phospholipase family protein, partial [bacterium]
SAGAINAALFALGYTITEQRTILKKLSFKNLMDDDFGVVRDMNRLMTDFGWYKGDFFHQWMSNLIEKKLGSASATFRNLREAGRPDLYVYGTNLSTRFGEVFSFEHTPKSRIADAIRISMSIPLFFAASRNARRDVYVDGGVLDNFPVKLFDREKYLEPEARARMGIKTAYYQAENSKFLKRNPSASPYIYNMETLGFRLDSKEEIGVFRDGDEPQHHKINDLFDYIQALMTTMLEHQGNTHLHSDDWQRTIYIHTCGVGTTDFDLSEVLKKKLEQSGHDAAVRYFEWFDHQQSHPVNRP